MGLPPIVEAKGVSKTFGPVRALRGVDLCIRPGEVHALIGENGAGKSTLMKILSGAQPPSGGELLLDGREWRPADPMDARRAGVAMIYQELTLAPHLSIAENLLLGMEKGWKRRSPKAWDKVREVLHELQLNDLHPDTPVSALSVGQQQMVEIARALYHDSRVVIMDEPTSSLSARDTHQLFQAVQGLKSKGVAVVYISHFLEEVKELCDHATILRDGETVHSSPMAELDISTIITHMAGRRVDELYPPHNRELGAEIYKVSDLHGLKLPCGASFALRKGEVLGLFGLVGSGRTELLRSVFGLEPTQSGRVELSRQVLTGCSPRVCLKAGLDLLSEGLAQNLSLMHNVSLSRLRGYLRFGLLHHRREREQTERELEAMGTKYHASSDPASSLSGGNQQKVALARLAHREAQVLMLDEPTRGIDVGSKSEIYEHIHQLAQRGKALVVVSSYLPELMGICDTLAVMHRGELSEKRKVEDWSTDAIMAIATTGRTQEAS